MSGPGREPPPVVRDDDDEEGSRITREIAGRAIRRLGLLEGAIMAAAAGLALLAGAVAAFLLAASGFPFRTTWAVASILFFTVPAVAIWVRDRRAS